MSSMNPLDSHRIQWLRHPSTRNLILYLHIQIWTWAMNVSLGNDSKKRHLKHSHEQWICLKQCVLVWTCEEVGRMNKERKRGSILNNNQLTLYDRHILLSNAFFL